MASAKARTRRALIRLIGHSALNAALSSVNAGNKKLGLQFLGEGAVPAQAFLGIRSSASIDEMGVAMERKIKKLRVWMASSDVEVVGYSFSIYHQWNPTKGTTDFTLAFPLECVLDSPA